MAEDPLTLLIVNENIGDDVPLFARLLGGEWDALPAAVREMHTVTAERVAHGRCTILRGSGLLGNVIAALFGFPKAAADLPVSVCFTPRNASERWVRRFGDHVMSSVLSPGRGRSERLICERFGPFDFAQALSVDGGRLRYVMRRWSVFAMPLPKCLAPRSNSYETERDGRFEFHVQLSLPLLGPIVSYRGWLVVQA